MGLPRAVVTLCAIAAGSPNAKSGGKEKSCGLIKVLGALCYRLEVQTGLVKNERVNIKGNKV